MTGSRRAHHRAFAAATAGALLLQGCAVRPIAALGGALLQAGAARW